MCASACMCVCVRVCDYHSTVNCCSKSYHNAVGNDEKKTVEYSYNYDGSDIDDQDDDNADLRDDDSHDDDGDDDDELKELW